MVTKFIFFPNQYVAWILAFLEKSDFDYTIAFLLWSCSNDLAIMALLLQPWYYGLNLVALPFWPCFCCLAFVALINELYGNCHATSKTFQATVLASKRKMSCHYFERRIIYCRPVKFVYNFKIAIVKAANVRITWQIEASAIIWLIFWTKQMSMIYEISISKQTKNVCICLRGLISYSKWQPILKLAFVKGFLKQFHIDT